MNLYKFHAAPESLDHHDKHKDIVPELVYAQAIRRDIPHEERVAYMKAHRKAFLTNASYAHRYADVVGDRDPEIEAEIKKVPYEWDYYMRRVVPHLK